MPHPNPPTPPHRSYSIHFTPPHPHAPALQLCEQASQLSMSCLLSWFSFYAWIAAAWHARDIVFCCSFLLRAFSRLSPALTSMADLPRWVHRSDVDSSAMLCAFLAYHHEVSAMLQEKHGLSYRPVWEGHLWSFNHEAPPGLEGLQVGPMPLRIPRLPCREPACPYCGVCVGVVFRWYSPYWADAYNRMRRPGSWKAPEPLYANFRAGGTARCYMSVSGIPHLSRRERMSSQPRATRFRIAINLRRGGKAVTCRYYLVRT